MNLRVEQMYVPKLPYFLSHRTTYTTIKKTLLRLPRVTQEWLQISNIDFQATLPNIHDIHNIKDSNISNPQYNNLPTTTR